MNPTIVRACVQDQHLQLVAEPFIASGGVNIVQIQFDFCGLWTGCGKTAVFYRDPDTVYHVPIVDNLATVPHEVMADEGLFYLGVVGSASNVRTTEVIKVKVVRGALTAATVEPGDPTPDIYQQMMARFDEAIAMRSAEGSAVYEYDNETFMAYNPYFFSNEPAIKDGVICTNGSAVVVDLRFINLVLDIPNSSGTSLTRHIHDLPETLVPIRRMALTAEIYRTETNEKVSDIVGYVDVNGAGKPVLVIDNTSEYSTGSTNAIYVHGSYDLPSISIAELADVRVGADGTTYPTAGDAVRAIEGKIPESVFQDETKTYTTIADQQIEIVAGENDDSMIELHEDGIDIHANGGVSISNVVDPTQDDDAVNKKYVDDIAKKFQPGGGGGSASCRFVAEYNVTPFEEIEAAYKARLELQLKQDNLVGCLTLARITEEQSAYDYAQFELFDYNGYMRSVRVTRDNTWAVVNAPYASVAYVGEKVGDIETALDGIIAIQTELIGGDAE